MIDIEKYKIILDEGLLLDHYFLLCTIRDGKELAKNRRIQGFINLMHKKGYIDDGILTTKAFNILDGEGNENPIKPIRMLQVPEPEEKAAKMDYAGWIIGLHRKCQDKLEKATGKKQVRDKIDGKPYPFLPNVTDLGKVILKVIQTYKLKDFAKIEKTILAYIDKCIKANKWFPVLNYYVFKNNMSQMITDMESGDEESTGGTDNASIHIV